MADPNIYLYVAQQILRLYSTRMVSHPDGEGWRRKKLTSKKADAY